MWRNTSQVPNQPKTPQRAVRVPTPLWAEAMAIAKARSETLSDVIRDALEAYVKKYGRGSGKQRP